MHIRKRKHFHIHMDMLRIAISSMYICICIPICYDVWYMYVRWLYLYLCCYAYLKSCLYPFCNLCLSGFNIYCFPFVNTIQNGGCTFFLHFLVQKWDPGRAQSDSVWRSPLIRLDWFLLLWNRLRHGYHQICQGNISKCSNYMHL